MLVNAQFSLSKRKNWILMQAHHEQEHSLVSEKLIFKSYLFISETLQNLSPVFFSFNLTVGLCKIYTLLPLNFALITMHGD